MNKEVLKEKFSEEQRKHFEKDIEYLNDNFNVKGKLLNIINNQGDSHCNGKTVSVFEFENGKVMYKPRDMNLDEQFYYFLSDTKSILGFKNIRFPKCKSFGEYSWQKYIEYKDCKMEDEVKEFYFNIGVYSCIFYLFITTDLHMENIIAHGSIPFFVDLESLFQICNTISNDDDNANGIIRNKILNSVMSTHLFPMADRIFDKADFSGITGINGQIIPKSTIKKVADENELEHLTREDYVIDTGRNIPKLNGEFADPREYVLDILDGFETCYKGIMNNKSKIKVVLEEVDYFKGCKARAIFRDTSAYVLLLQRLSSPKYKTNLIEREKQFDWLKKICEFIPEMNLVVNSEIEDMKNWDIPFFYSHIGENYVYDSKGKVCYELEKTSLDLFLERLENMSIKDLKFQKFLINASMKKHKKVWKDKTNIITMTSLNNNDIDLVGESEKIAKLIIDKSIMNSDKTQINWLGVEISDSGAWLFEALDPYMYNGLIGIAMFFSSLYKTTNKGEYRDTLYKILSTIEYNMQNNLCLKEDISAFSGISSLVYGYYFIGLQQNDKNLIEKSKEYIRQIEAFTEKFDNYDLISGVAGIIIVLCNIFKIEQDKNILNLAIKCADFLIENATNDDKIFGWKSFVNDKILSGLAHGNSGIALALLELYEITDKNIYKEFSIKAIEYENSYYNKTFNNWINEKDIVNKEQDSVFWCYGATGIGLSRNRMNKIVQTNQIEADLKNATRKVLKDGFGGSSCLCHGDFGSIDLLVETGYIKEAREKVKSLIEMSNKHGWIMGTAQDFYSPSFMTGLSGIGYELLKTAYPLVFPSILILDLPQKKEEYES